MNLLEVTGLSQSFGDKILYENASFELFKGEHAGIVGINGAGKSTLIKILADSFSQESGTVIWQKGIRIGYLDQHAEVSLNLTIRDYLRSTFQSLYEREKQLNEIYAQPDLDEMTLKQAGRIQDELIGSNFYTLDSKIEKVAQGLGLAAVGMDRPLATLSGGQRAKVILSKLLLEECDVLLLDEPTNFLDSVHIDWLAGYLSQFKGAFLVVSHDFSFLDRITTVIFDVEYRRVQKYYARYTDFVKQKEHLHLDHVRRYEAQKREIEKTEAFIRKNIAGNNSKIARGRRKQLERVERLAPPAVQIHASFRFPELPVFYERMMEAEKLEIGYEHPLLKPLSFSLSGNEKLVITGFNGVGKSTLLKTCIGQIKPLFGTIQVNGSVKISYFEQETVWEDGRKTPADLISDKNPKLTVKEIRSHLAQCGIRQEQAVQSVTILSGGEQAKTKLALLLMEPCSYLILDEPTNHLDADTKAALKKALRAFQGGLVLVCHEKEFYEDWADRIWNISE